MSTLPVIEQIALGAAAGGAYAYVGYRLGRSGPGLIDRLRAKRRLYLYYAAAWLGSASLNLWSFGVWGQPAWHLVVTAVSLAMAGRLVWEARRLKRLLNDPFIYLAALRDAFGVES